MKTYGTYIPGSLGLIQQAQADFAETIAHMVSFKETAKPVSAGDYPVRFAIEPAAGATYASGEPTLYGYGNYEQSSVNHGMEMRAFIERLEEDEIAHFVEFAKANGLDVEVTNSSGYRQQELPQEAPSWFDPAAAGEVWGEDDY